MNPARFLIAATCVALCGTGGVMLGRGLAVPIEAWVAQDRLAQDFAERLAANRAAGPSDPAGTRSIAQRPLPIVPPEGALEAGPEAAIARLSVPRLGVREFVLAGNGTHEQLAQGPTMIRQGDAASPVTVLAAHRDTHFLFIRDLREGDRLQLQLVTGETRHYRITRFETVRWDRFAYPLDPARPLLALSTCFPFGGTEYGGPWRRIAWAEQTDG